MKKLITIIIASLLLPILAFAQTNNEKPTGDFTIYPTYKHGESAAWIVDTVNPGDNYTDYLTLQNLSDKQQTITLKVHEAEQKDTFVINEDTENYKDLGNWLSLEEDTHTLYPGEIKKIPLYIMIPSNINPKEYTGTILASQSNTSDQGINIVTRIGVRTYLTVSNHELQASTLNVSSPLTPLFLALSIIGLLGAITLNVISFTNSKKNDQ